MKAEYSECKRYRYWLREIWNPHGPMAVIIGLNPKTNELKDRQLTRCKNLAKEWCCGGYVNLNLFGLRCDSDEKLLLHPNPIGPDNDKHIVEMTTKYDHQIVAVWGRLGVHLERSKQICALVKGMYCLGRVENLEPQNIIKALKEFEPIPYP